MFLHILHIFQIKSRVFNILAFSLFATSILGLGFGLGLPKNSQMSETYA